MRRITVWLGVGVMLLLALAFSSWGVLAYQPAPAKSVPLQAQGSGAGAGDAYILPNLGVLLRGLWWESVPGVDRATRISTSLLDSWHDSPASEKGFMVYLKAQADTSNTITDWNAKGEYVLRALETVANATQPSLMQAINSHKATGTVSKATAFTIINAVFVHGTLAAATDLARRGDVAFIDADHQYHLMSGTASTAAADLLASTSSPDTVEVGVSYVHAPQVWATGDRGQGIVVGSIDTGVQYDHPALVRQYRGNLGNGSFDHNYNWWDTRTDAPPHPVPYDDYGHGTHTAGTVLGEDASQTNQIGVAPGAKWMAAKVFPNGGSSGNEEITPAEDFMLAPWDLNGQNRRPDLRPQIVTNSWGDDECWNTDSWLITQAWIDAGIMPSFANGNAGPGAGTVGSPGGYPFLLGVGAISATSNTIAGFSSRGPSCYGGALKPDVVAPGVNVRSSFPGNTYGTASGTSMATPHNSGVMALILSANPSLTYTDVMGILTRTTYWNAGWGTRPNNNYGWGAIQADAAVNMALHGPRVNGTVHGSGSSVLNGARVTAVRQGDSDTYSALARNGGTYSMTLLAGTYDVTASMFGYQSQTLANQQLLTDTTNVLDFHLAPLATHTVSGHLYQAVTCNPISGTINIDPPAWLTVTTGTSGTYSVDLPAGTYRFTVRAGAGYQSVVQSVIVGGANVSQDFTLGPAHDGSYVVDMPAFNWIPGTSQVSFSDGEDGYATVALPFSFSYYGNTYTSINMSTNGFATFDGTTEAGMWANTDIPNSGPTSRNPSFLYPNNAIYPYWDDLSVAPRSYGNGYYGVSGTAPNRVFVLEWRGVGGTGAPVTFEVQLEESTNRISFMYQNIGGPYGYGYSATEGIENATGTDGIEFGENWMGIVGDGQAYRFTPGQAPAVTPCAPATSTVTPTPTQCAIHFSDVQPGAYYYEDVRCVYCLGAISGYADGTFRPFNDTTRSQMTKIVVIALRIATATPTGAPTFNDVPASNPFYAYVETAAANGIVSGYNCGGPGEPCPGQYFRPFANVTRGQLSKIVVVAANHVYHWTILNPSVTTFNDVPRNSTFFTYIETAVCHGVISGYADGSFRPGNNAIRAQIAKIVCRTSQNPPDICSGPTPTASVPGR